MYSDPQKDIWNQNPTHEIVMNNFFDFLVLPLLL